MQATWLLAEEIERLRDLGAPAVVFGILAFGSQLVRLVATLAFGKGRPHS